MFLKFTLLFTLLFSCVTPVLAMEEKPGEGKIENDYGDRKSIISNHREQSQSREPVHFPTAEDLAATLKELGFDTDSFTLQGIKYSVKVPEFLKNTLNHKERTQALVNRSEKKDHILLTRESIPDRFIRFVVLDWKEGRQNIQGVYGVTGLNYDPSNFIYLIVEAPCIAVDVKQFKKEGADNWHTIYNLPISNPKLLDIYPNGLPTQLLSDPIDLQERGHGG